MVDTENEATEAMSNNLTSVFQANPKVYTLEIREQAIRQILDPHPVDNPDGLIYQIPASMVMERWAEYLESILPSEKMLAIYRDDSTNEKNLRIVYVTQVNYASLEAKVQVLKNHVEDTGYEQKEEDYSNLTVFLYDLIPIYDEKNQQLSEDVSKALYFCRFFFKKLWFLWDEQDDTEDWVGEHLSNRIGLVKQFEEKHQQARDWHEIRRLQKNFEEVQKEMKKLDEDSHTMNEVEARYNIALLLELEEQGDQIERQAKNFEDKMVRDSMVLLRLRKAKAERPPDNKSLAFIVKNQCESSEQYLAFAKAVSESNYCPSDRFAVKTKGSLSEALNCALDGDVVLLAAGEHHTDNLEGADGEKGSLTFVCVVGNATITCQTSGKNHKFDRVEYKLKNS